MAQSPSARNNSVQNVTVSTDQNTTVTNRPLQNDTPSSNNSHNEVYNSMVEFFLPGRGIGGSFLLLLGGITLIVVVLNEMFSVTDRITDGYTIEISPPAPDWMRTNLWQDVCKFSNQAANPGIDRMKFSDETLLQTLHDAFLLQPSVEEIVQIKKIFPDKVSVTLKYRQPVAMVKVKLDNGGDGFLPVNSTGIRMSSSDFSPADLQKYFTIIGNTSSRPGQLGLPWGDHRVTVAAAVAGALFPYKDDFKIRNIYVTEGKEVNERQVYNIRLETDKHVWIAWGSYTFIENEIVFLDQIPAEEKIRQLQRLKETAGELICPTDQVFIFHKTIEPASQK